MLYYKDQANGENYAFDGNDESLIAQYIKPEWVRIVALPEPPVPDPVVVAKDAIRAKIKALEAEQLMPRATREFMLLFMESSFPPEALAANHGYQSVKAFDQQIQALRDQLA